MISRPPRNSPVAGRSSRGDKVDAGVGISMHLTVAVGTRLTPRPPHRSERALLTHSALALDV
jgi:hypothetical protein